VGDVGERTSIALTGDSKPIQEFNSFVGRQTLMLGIGVQVNYVSDTHAVDNSGTSQEWGQRDI
jgi:hypothetical protein